MTTPTPQCKNAQSIIPSNSLPLRLLPRHELIQNPHNLLQRHQPRIQLPTHPPLIIAQLRIKVLPVRRRTHRRAKNRLDNKRVVFLERIPVRIPKRRRQFFRGGAEVLPQSLRRKIQTTIQP